MIKNATRIIAFLLLMLLISTSLISCNGDTPDNTPDTDLPDDGTTDGTAPDDGNTDSGNTDSEGDSGEIDWDNLPMNGLALIYNLDKKTLGKMKEALGRDVEADDVIVYSTDADNDNLVG